ncbi:MAG: serine/threonine-protein kinase [Gemmatimonadales bacterium]
MARDLLPIIRNALEGRYTVGREIGRGGAARVFSATDPSNRPVALKVLHPQLAASVTADRFLREVKFIGRLDHPHIARLVDSGEDEWLIWYVMDFVPGPTMRQHLERARRVSTSDTLRIAQDMLAALTCAHAQGIVHRDVKPENIVLSPGGAVLVDFGIAKAVADAGSDRLTRSGFAVGTSAYMSPEQVGGIDGIDARSDLYSLACVLYECLAGRPPYDDPFEELVLHKHQTAPVPDVSAARPDTPASLASAITRALAKDPGDRWASAAAMLASLPVPTPA